ncbi:MAG: type III pantothenate kinase [Candidatus Omnitrophota bacterium]
MMRNKRSKTLLAIDVGNTTVAIGIFTGKKLVRSLKIPTKKPADRRFYHAVFRKIVGANAPEAVIISSVVPALTGILKTLFTDIFRVTPVILGDTFAVPIRNLYRDPRQVGQDRLVNAFAGYHRYGGGLIIVDFGTAITFDIVSRRGSYVGGIIVPGLMTSLNALSDRASLLPRIHLRRGRSLIGKNTVASMNSGILNGFGALCDGLIEKIHRKYPGYKVIFTGGDAALMAEFCHADRIDRDLTLRGLFLIYASLT